jgi:hypothetical protein
MVMWYRNWVFKQSTPQSLLVIAQPCPPSPSPPTCLLLLPIQWRKHPRPRLHQPPHQAHILLRHNPRRAAIGGIGGRQQPHQVGVPQGWGSSVPGVLGDAGVG